MPRIKSNSLPLATDVNLFTVQRCGLLESLRRLNLTFWWGVFKAHLLLKKILLKTFYYFSGTWRWLQFWSASFFSSSSVTLSSLWWMPTRLTSHTQVSCWFHIANPLDFSIQLTSVAAILNYLVTRFYHLCNAHIRFLYHRISALVLITVDQHNLVHITIFWPSHRGDLLKLQCAGIKTNFSV